MDYYKYYIQKEETGSSVKELGEDFGFYEMECKFFGGNEAKDVPKREWYDENGDDEFVPAEQKYKSFEIDVKFGYKGKMNSANAALNKLRDYLNGGTMKIFDTYNNTGRQNVRFLSINDEAELIRDKEDGDILLITAKFKVNDPVTDIYLTR